MLKGKPPIKKKSDKAKRKSDALTKKVLATTAANIARIEAEERGEKPKTAKAERDTTALAEFFPREGKKPRMSKDAARAEGAARTKAALANGKKPNAAKPPKAKRMSGLDAAAKVLVESKEPLGAQDIVKAMETKGYWKSPGGKTPHATIYAAMVREITEKGKAARFKKVDRGMFAANAGGK